MKKIITLIAAITLYSLSSQAAFYCEASSPYGFGSGEARSLSVAKRIAIRYCRINTPRGYYCYLDGCERTYYSEDNGEQLEFGNFEKAKN